MKLTIEHLDLWFEKYNKLYFGNKVKKPYFSFIKTKKTLGRYRVQKNYYGENEYIQMSIFLERTEKEYQTTFIHEMIHAYIYQQKIIETSSHGKVFMSIAERINLEGGWNIQAKTKIENYTINSCIKIKDMFILVYMTKTSNELFFARVAEKYVNTINKNLLCDIYPNIVAFEWYVGKIPELMQITQTRKNIYRIALDASYLKGLKPLKV